MGEPRGGATAGSAGPAPAEGKAYDRDQEGVAAAAGPKPKKLLLPTYMSSAEFQKKEMQDALVERNKERSREESQKTYDALKKLKDTGFDLSEGLIDKIYLEGERANKKGKNAEMDVFFHVGYNPNIRRQGLQRSQFRPDDVWGTTIPEIAVESISEQVALDGIRQLILAIQKQSDAQLAIPFEKLLTEKERFAEFAALPHDAKKDLYKGAKQIIEIFFTDLQSKIRQLDEVKAELDRLRARQGQILLDEHKGEAKRLVKEINDLLAPISEALNAEANDFELDEEVAAADEEEDIFVVIKQCRESCERVQKIANRNKCVEPLNELHKQIAHLEFFHGFQAQVESTLAELNKRADQGKLFAPACELKLKEIEAATQLILKPGNNSYKGEELALLKRKAEETLQAINKIRKQPSSSQVYNALDALLTSLEFPTARYATLIPNGVILEELNKIIAIPSQKEQLQKFDAEILLPPYKEKAKRIKARVDELRVLNEVAGNKHDLGAVLKKIDEVEKAKTSTDAKKALDAVYTMLKDKKYLSFGITHVSQNAEASPLIVADDATDRIGLLNYMHVYMKLFASSKTKDHKGEVLKQECQLEMKALLNREYTDIHLEIKRVEGIVARCQDYLNRKSAIRTAIVSSQQASEEKSSPQEYITEKAFGDKIDAGWMQKEAIKITPDELQTILQTFLAANFSESIVKSEAIRTRLQKLSGENMGVDSDADEDSAATQRKAIYKDQHAIMEDVFKYLGALSITDSQRTAMKRFNEDHVLAPLAHEKAKALEKLLRELVDIHELANSKEISKLKSLLSDAQQAQTMSSEGANTATDRIRSALYKISSLGMLKPIIQTGRYSDGTPFATTTIVVKDEITQKIDAFRAAKICIDCIDQMKNDPALAIKERIKKDMNNLLNEKHDKVVILNSRTLKAKCEIIKQCLDCLQQAEKIKKALTELLLICKASGIEDDTASSIRRKQSEIDAHIVTLGNVSYDQIHTIKIAEIAEDINYLYPLNDQAKAFIAESSQPPTKNKDTLPASIKKAKLHLDRMPEGTQKKELQGHMQTILTETTYLGGQSQKVKDSIAAIIQAVSAVSPTHGAGVFDHGHQASAVKAAAASAAVAAPAEKKAEKMGLIRCYLDFDGTLTSLRGSDCINSPLYRSLKKTANDEYQNAEFKSQQAMVDSLKAAFADNPNHPLKVTTEALEFLQKMLTSEAEVIIVSKNRCEYIQAVLLASGVSPENVAKIIIRDVKNLNEIDHETGDFKSKFGVVSDYEKSAKKPADVVVVCDDSLDDHKEMVLAVGGEHRLGLISESMAPGNFRWLMTGSDVTLKARKAVESAALRHDQSDGGAAAGPTPSR